MTLTANKSNRVKQALIETEDCLDRELGYSKDLQSESKINFYRNHIEKLKKMIADKCDGCMVCAFVDGDKICGRV